VVEGETAESAERMEGLKVIELEEVEISWSFSRKVEREERR
jgi:hypothetical protein